MKCGLVAVPNIEMAEEVVRKATALGISCAVIHSKLPKAERERVVRGHKDGSIKWVVNVMCLSVGYDNPLIDALIFSRPTLSLRIWQQFVGRGVRLADNKRICNVIDMTGTFDKFGGVELIRAAKEPGGFRTIIRGQFGIISDKALSKINLTRIIKNKERNVEWKKKKI